MFEAEGLETHHIEHSRTESSESASTAPYAEHGAPIDRSMTAEMKKQAGRQLLWPRMRRVIREPLSEFMGSE